MFEILNLHLPSEAISLVMTMPPLWQLFATCDNTRCAGLGWAGSVCDQYLIHHTLSSFVLQIMCLFYLQIWERDEEKGDRTNEGRG